MFELIKIIAIVFSLSFRTANIPDKPFDYEFMLGTEGKYSQSMLMYERENNEDYYGYEIEYGFEYIQLDSYKKTAKNIDNQKLSILYPVKDSSLGLSLGAKRWKEPVPLLTALYKNKYLKIDYSRGIKRETIEVDLKYKIKINEQISLTPLVLLKKFDNEAFWQMKITFEVRI